MLPLWGRVDLGAMTMKSYTAFPKNPSITEALQSDCLISYPGHSLGESNSSAEMKSAYFTVLADWAYHNWKKNSWMYTVPQGIIALWNAASSRIWTRVPVSISYDDNHYISKLSYNIKP